MEGENERKMMNGLIDKLCDHMNSTRIKILIDNGFDQWNTVAMMKGNELIEMGYTSQQCIILMAAINSNAKQFHQCNIFTQQTLQQIIQKARLNDESRKIQIQNEQQKYQQNKLKQKEIIKSKQYQSKDISQQLLIKGSCVKSKVGEKIIFNKLTLISLEERNITEITLMDKVPLLQNLYLGRNHIYSMKGIEKLTKLRVLKMQNNQLRSIEALNDMHLLEKLHLNGNKIDVIQNLCNNPKLTYLNISNQKISNNLVFQEQSCIRLGYSLQKLQANSCNMKHIEFLKQIISLQQIQLKDNKLDDIGSMSQSFRSWTVLKSLDLRNNPITKVPKYRDYVVIMSKSIEQLDNKNILAKQRQYLLKLYSLKHAKQQKQGTQKNINMINCPIDLHVTKISEKNNDGGQQKYNQGIDLRGNIPYANTKVTRK